MSLLSRFATRAVQRENERLYTRNDRLSEDLRAVGRKLTAALERNGQYVRDAYQAAINVQSLGDAYDKVRAEHERVLDALQHAQAERDQLLADLDTARDDLRTTKRELVDAYAENAIVVADKNDLRGQIEDLTSAKRLWDKHLAACPVAQTIADEDQAKAASNT